MIFINCWLVVGWLVGIMVRPHLFLNAVLGVFFLHAIIIFKERIISKNYHNKDNSPKHIWFKVFPFKIYNFQAIRRF